MLQVLSQDGRASYTILFNTTATHGLPAAINQASSALLRAITGNPGAGISVRNHPMPTLQQEAAVQFSKEAGITQRPCLVKRLSCTLSLFAYPYHGYSFACSRSRYCCRPQCMQILKASGCASVAVLSDSELLQATCCWCSA